MNDRRDSVPTTPAPITVRVWHCPEGGTHFVRTLSDQIYGIKTHWFRARTRICKAEDCPSDRHKVDSIWYGYTPVEVWEDAKQLWYPQVMQLSEHLELDFRDILARGQVWQITRDPRTQKNSNPVCGRLLQVLEPSKLPASFDLRPILVSVYHEASLPVSVKNPLPQRVVLAPSPGEPPQLVDIAEELRAPTAEDWTRWRSVARRPKPGVNGSR